MRVGMGAKIRIPVFDIRLRVRVKPGFYAGNVRAASLFPAPRRMRPFVTIPAAGHDIAFPGTEPAPMPWGEPSSRPRRPRPS
jgi:hypothetical protein